MRASEFQSHSKQSSDVITSAEEDSAAIVKDVVQDIAGDKVDTSSGGAIDVNIDPNWGQW